MKEIESMRTLTILALVLGLAGCGRDTSTVPLERGDSSSVTPGADGGVRDADPSEDGAVTPDGGSHAQICTPSEMSCDTNVVRQCTPDGTARNILYDCRVNPIQNACGFCNNGAHACISTLPLCQGTIAGFGASPWSFVTNGCNEFECSPRATRLEDGRFAFMLDLSGGPLKKVHVSIPDLSRVISGAVNGFLADGDVGLQFEDAAGRHCWPYNPRVDQNPPPWSGQVTVTWEGTALKSLFSFDFDGPVACDLARREWFDVHGHVDTRLVDVD